MFELNFKFKVLIIFIWKKVNFSMLDHDPDPDDAMNVDPDPESSYKTYVDRFAWWQWAAVMTVLDERRDPPQKGFG